MNRLKIYLTCLLTSACMLNIGCVSTMSDHAKSAYNNVKRELRGKPGTTQTDALYAQVNHKDQLTVQQLRDELAQAEHERELAKLEKERDDLQRERSRVNAKRTDLLAQEKEHRVELAKLEAIDRNQLGDKISNIEAIADTHVDALEIQQKRLQLDGEVGILDVKIKQLKEMITTQQNKMQTAQTDDTKTHTNG